MIITNKGKLLKKKIILLMFIAVMIWIMHNIWISDDLFDTSFYELELNEVEVPFRIIQISDLHNSEFGEANSELIEEIKNLDPDLVFITGDIVNGNEPERDIAVRLVENLVEFVPVYFSYGNHDKCYEQQHFVDLNEEFSDVGAVVLDNSFVDISVGTQDIRIGGTDGYCLPERFAESKNLKQDEYDFLKDFQDTERYKILLSHLPTPWIEYEFYKDWDVDLVFAGHTHGGQIILPIIGGVFAPDFGWLPGKLWGIYDYSEYGTQVILSRGMGSAGNLIRFNNVPELVVVDIKPEN